MNLPFNNGTLPEMLAILENYKKGDAYPDWLKFSEYDHIKRKRIPRIIANFTYKDWQITLSFTEDISWHFIRTLPTGSQLKAFTSSPKDPFLFLGEGFTKRFYDRLDRDIKFFNENQFLEHCLGELVQKVFLEGFKISCEGWNYEYSYQQDKISPESDQEWIETRDSALRKFIIQPEITKTIKLLYELIK